MNKTKIQYMDYSWNPLAMRCTSVSAGCKNCWHLRMANRLAKNPKMLDIERQAYAGETAPVLMVHRLQELYKPRKAARIGVQFMGDLFLESVPDESILHVFDTMANDWICHHTFLVLTKRPQRMLDWFGKHGQYLPLPLENIQVGVSVENQKTADERIPLLLQIPATVRFVSVEPMLEAVDLTNISYHHPAGGIHKMDALAGYGGWQDYDRNKYKLDWVIVGAESGPGARPMDEDWVRDIRDQCVAAGVPLFYKQKLIDGKKVSMPELDGKQWCEYPKEMTQ